MSIKRVKINYQPIAKRKSNEIAFVVSKNHLMALNNSIHNKLERNKGERIESLKEAKDYYVGSNGNDMCSSNCLRRIKKI